MTIREKITQEISRIVKEGKEIDENIIRFVKEDFSQIKDDLEKMGKPLKQATYDTLESVEAGLKAVEHKAEDILSRSANAVVDVTRDATTKSVTVARTYAERAKTSLNKVVEKSFDGVDNIEAKTREEMENAYTILHEKTMSEKARLHEVSEGIKAYAESKAQELSDAKRKALHISAEKAKDELEAWVRASEEYSKKLLDHSQTQISEWLDKLKNKIHKKI